MNLLEIARTRAKNIFLRIRLNLVSLNILRILTGLESQKKLIIDITNEKKFLIIILDACRPDSFRRWISENRPFLLENLKIVRSEGTRTPAWFTKTFSENRSDLTYISGNPYINNAGITSVGKIARKVFTNIVDAWKKWDNKEETCMPLTLNEFSENYLHEPRLIVHYMQPHQPYVGKKRIPRYFYYKDLFDSMEESEDRPSILQINSRNLNKKDNQMIRDAYESNVDLVCSHAFNLIDKFKGTIIVTADHSEMMGENGVWFHNSGHPKLYIVPWLKIINK